MSENKEYVTCAVCGRKYVGKIPKGGDGTVLYPRKHYWLGPKDFRRRRVCDGSYMEAVEYKDK